MQRMHFQASIFALSHKGARASQKKFWSIFNMYNTNVFSLFCIKKWYDSLG